MSKLQIYAFFFFFKIFSSVLLSSLFLIGVFDLIFDFKPQVHDIRWLLERIIRSSIFSLEIAIPISFIVAYCFFKIKFNKSFELPVIRALGISRERLILPIFYFSIFCGFLLYCNQSFLAPIWNANLIKNYPNLSKNWLISGDKIIHFKNQSPPSFFAFSQKKESLEVEEYKENFLKKTYTIPKKPLSNTVFPDNVFMAEKIAEENFFLPLNANLSQKENFFYFTFMDLFPLVFSEQNHRVFEYIFFQKIADILSVFLLLLILLGRPSHPRNLDLEFTTVVEACFALLFLFTSQIGFFVFEAGLATPFFAAFGNYFVWSIFLIYRFLLKRI